ncbi:MAG: DUF4097 family beta strand repeat protein [Clostridiales bacterium]|nr:DUF4097 family beta strand repeat protein [Clostridiales bacterium]
MKKRVMVMMSVTAGMVLAAGCSKEEEPFVQKSYEVEGEQIEEVKLDVRDRRIEVSISEDNQIHMDYFENSKEFYDISVSEDHVLTVAAASDKEWKDYFGSKSAEDAQKIFLQIPDDLLEKLTLATTNEDLVIGELAVKGEISLSANGGDIILNKVNAGDTLNLTGKNGDIRGSVAGSYDDFMIQCDVKKGESNLPSNKENGTKILNVSNNNGDIDIEIG